MKLHVGVSVLLLFILTSTDDYGWSESNQRVQPNQIKFKSGSAI